MHDTAPTRRAVLASALLATPALAQGRYPEKPIRLLIRANWVLLTGAVLPHLPGPDLFGGFVP